MSETLKPQPQEEDVSFALDPMDSLLLVFQPDVLVRSVGLPEANKEDWRILMPMLHQDFVRVGKSISIMNQSSRVINLTQLSCQYPYGAVIRSKVALDRYELSFPAMRAIPKFEQLETNNQVHWLTAFKLLPRQWDQLIGKMGVEMFGVGFRHTVSLSSTSFLFTTVNRAAHIEAATPAVFLGHMMKAMKTHKKEYAVVDGIIKEFLEQ